MQVGFSDRCVIGWSPFVHLQGQGRSGLVILICSSQSVLVPRKHCGSPKVKPCDWSVDFCVHDGNQGLNEPAGETATADETALRRFA